MVEGGSLTTRPRRRIPALGNRRTAQGAQRPAQGAGRAATGAGARYAPMRTKWCGLSQMGRTETKPPGFGASRIMPLPA